MPASDPQHPASTPSTPPAASTPDDQPSDHPAGKIRLLPGVRVGARTFALLGLAAAAVPFAPTPHPTGSFPIG